MLGTTMQDSVTGYVGVVVSEHNYLNGATEYGLQAPMSNDGRLPEIVYFKKDRLEEIGRAHV